MKFRDKPLTVLTRTAETECLRVTSYTSEDIELGFDYQFGEEQRNISVVLSKDEAIILVNDLMTAINTDATPGHTNGEPN